MNILQKFEPNREGCDFAVGDLHGCYDLLMYCLDTHKFDKDTDRLFCVGDLIDRGNDSEKCVRLLEEPWFFSVMGNHEQMLLEKMPCWYRHGGRWWESVKPEDRSYLENAIEQLPLIIQVGDIGIMHTDPMGVSTWDDIVMMAKCSQQFRDRCLWGRIRAKTGPLWHIQGIRRIICGHTVLRNPKEVDNFMFIDTGAVYYNQLTFASLYSLETYTIKGR